MYLEDIACCSLGNTLRGRKISFILFGGFIIVKRGIKMRRRMEINHHRTYRGKAAVFLLVTAALLAWMCE